MNLNCETCGTYPNCKDCTDESKYTDKVGGVGVILWGAISLVTFVIIVVVLIIVL